MAKLIPMHEAAQLLGLTVEELNELRSRNEIFGYRDGPSWKFKEEEIQRVAALRASEARTADAGDASADELLGFDDDLDQLVDVSEMETPDRGTESSDDDELVLDDDSMLGGEDDQAKSSTVIGSDSELSLDEDLQLSSDDSDLLDLTEASDSDQMTASGSNDKDQTAGEGGDELRLAPDDEFELSITGSESVDEPDDDFRLSDAELDLGSESDIDLVLDNEALTESPSEISAESDLTLEGAPTELAGPSDDDLQLSDDMVKLADEDEAADTDGSTQLKADDDFLLTPVDGGVATDESDSGSQVIELDEDFEDAEQGMFVEEAGDQVLDVDEDSDLATLGEESVTDLGEAPAGDAGLARVGAQPEEEYSVWNVLGLVLIVVIFLPTSIMMVDLMRNMWSWSGANPLNSRLMDAILGMFGA